MLILAIYTIELICLHMLGLELFGVVAGHFIDVAALDGAAEWIYAAVRVAVAITGALDRGSHHPEDKKHGYGGKIGE